MNQLYGELLLEYAERNPEIFILEADLMRAHNTESFAKKYPNRFLNVGVAEANMAGIAAGLAVVGKKPFIHSFTPFVSRRIFDQVYVSIAYAELAVKIVGTSPGVTAGINGGTHMSFEDFAIYRSIPNMVIFEPADGKTLKLAFEQIINSPFPLYMRLNRSEKRNIPAEINNIELGKAIRLREGSHVTIIAMGFLVHEALTASDILREKGILSDVIYVHTLKPIDKTLILDSVKKTGVVVTAENHSIYGGLGDTVLDILRDNNPVYLEKVGVKDHFGEVGSVEFLVEKFGLTSGSIVDAVHKVLCLKN